MNSIGTIGRAVFVAATLLLCPSIVFAQAAIAGIAQDTSGAVLPGVTVEASSAALIEKVRSVVTDGAGQYRIINLPPGSYSVTFTLPGFATVRREGIQLTGAFTATVNAQLSVGEVSETVTVTGEAPVVDIQSTTQQRVMNKEVLDALPTGRTLASLSVLIPGMTVTRAFNGNLQDVGGTTGEMMQRSMVHGSLTQDNAILLDGLAIGSEQGQSLTNLMPNFGSIGEFAVDTAGGSAEQRGSGPRFNLIPRTGGNTFSGSLFATGTTEALQGDNVTAELTARGLTAPSALKSQYDFNPSFGGPIARDRLWFFASGRWFASDTHVNLLFNKNAGNPNNWTYEPDPSRTAVIGVQAQSYNARVTWQVNPKNQVSYFHDEQRGCTCDDMRINISPESGQAYRRPGNRISSTSWMSPMTNRLLFEAGYLYTPQDWGYTGPEGVGFSDAAIGVIEQAGTATTPAGMQYHGITSLFQRTHTDYRDHNLRGSMAYVTGSHALKVGFQQHWLHKIRIDGATNLFQAQAQGLPNPFLTYTFRGGVPISLQQRLPRGAPYHIAADGGIYAQDRWTMRRLTLNLGVRFDFFADDFPATTLGPEVLAPNRNIAIPATDMSSLKDLTPKVAAAYDLFGTGKTVLKGTAGKYVQPLGSSCLGCFSELGPGLAVSNIANRAWTDLNGNFFPDCDLTSPAAQSPATTGSVDVCGRLSDQNFGGTRPVTNVDEDLRFGWGKRIYNWEFSAVVQQELRRNMALEVGYFRRIYGNLQVTDNRAVTAADFSKYSITAPVDSRLPGGGGYTISNLYNVSNAQFGHTDNLVTFAKNFGDSIQHYDGIDVSVNARFAQGAFVQGGVNIGRTLIDRCDIADDLPELGDTSLAYCRETTPLDPNVKLVGSYTVPVIDVQASATFQSAPGSQLVANVDYPNAAISAALGRPVSSFSQTTRINVISPTTDLVTERLYQLDVRFGKVFRFGARRATVSVDLYNLTNDNSVLLENTTFSAWRVPQQVHSPRLVKFSVNLDF